MGAVLMDLDGTLLPAPSSEARFITYLALRAKLGPVQIVSALGFYAVYWRRFGHHVGRKNKAYLTNLRRRQIELLAARFVQQKLLPRLRPAVLGRLRSHQRAGDKVVLLTGAPDFLAAPLAAALGVQRWYATECAYRGERFHWRPPLRHPLAAEKLKAAQWICRQEHIDLRDCTAYADSIHDLPLLERVARAVVVHPDRALANIAVDRGWERLDGSAADASVRVSD